MDMDKDAKLETNMRRQLADWVRAHCPENDPEFAKKTWVAVQALLQVSMSIMAARAPQKIPDKEFIELKFRLLQMMGNEMGLDVEIVKLTDQN